MTINYEKIVDDYTLYMIWYILLIKINSTYT